MMQYLTALVAITLTTTETISSADVPTDLFVMIHGGQIEGVWVNQKRSSFEAYHIRHKRGGQIRLDPTQVSKVIRRSEDEVLYEEIRSGYPDTIDGHWKLAQWCSEKQLPQQRKIHLRRILKIDPDHEAARRDLGYRLVGKNWLTREEEMRDLGMTLYRGRYRTAQEIQLYERTRKQELAEKDWAKKLKRWNGWLYGQNGKKIDHAIKNIRGIHDPAAAKALAKSLQQATLFPAKQLFIDTLAQLGTATALEALAQQSLLDDNEEVRLSCLDFLCIVQRPRLINFYVRELKHKDNVQVNRAAVALNAIDNPDAIMPLIDALTTTHKFRTGNSSADQTSASFSSDGGFSFGKGGPQVIVKTAYNQDVLNALVRLSDGANFEYDKTAWTNWYASQKKLPSIDVRRD